MRRGIVVRPRPCPACDGTVRDRSARWCGSCGAPLEPFEPRTDDTAAARGPSPVWRRLSLGGAAAVLVALVVGTSGGLVDRASRSAAVPDVGVEAPDADALDDLPRGRPSEPPGVAEPTCSVGPPLGCFRWAIEIGGSAMYGSTVVGDGYVVTVQPTDRIVTAHRLRDGAAVWSVPGEVPPDGSVRLIVVDDLVLHHDDDALVARDLGSGVERWRNPDLASFSPHAAVLAGDDLVLAGHQGGFSSAGPIPPGGLLAALDVTSGQLHWHQSGESAAVDARGVGVLLADGRLRSHDRDGTLRWDVDAGTGDEADSGIWVAGHTVTVHSGAELPRLHLLRDGQELPFAADPLAHDATETLLIEAEEADEGGGYTHGDELILLDEAGEVWRTDAVGQLCWRPARFEPETITLTGCRGETTVLDRSSGDVRSRTEPDRDGQGSGFHGFRIGPYDLFHGGRGDGGDDLVIVDARSDTELARFPPDSWPVDDGDGLGREPDHGGVLVLQSRGWLVALDLPTRPTGGRDAGSYAQ